MSTPLKHFKKGSVSRFREMFDKIKKTPLSPKQREEILDVFKKKENPEKAEEIKPKKIAKPDQDLGV